MGCQVGNASDEAVWRGGRLVEAAAAVLFAAGALGLALHGGGLLALSDLGGLLVELAAAHLGQDAGLLAGALEAAQGRVKDFVFLYPYARQVDFLVARSADFSDCPLPLQLPLSFNDVWRTKFF